MCNIFVLEYSMGGGGGDLTDQIYMKFVWCLLGLQHSVVGSLICVIILWNLFSKNGLNKVLKNFSMHVRCQIHVSETLAHAQWHFTYP